MDTLRSSTLAPIDILKPSETLLHLCTLLLQASVLRATEQRSVLPEQDSQNQHSRRTTTALQERRQRLSHVR
jgi:hypothetical protein